MHAMLAWPCLQVITERLNADVCTVLTAAKLMQINDTPTTVRIFGRRVYCSLKEVSAWLHCSCTVSAASELLIHMGLPHCWH
jgi:hypothetical protein